jgi:hypothetical protein
VLPRAGGGSAVLLVGTRRVELSKRKCVSSFALILRSFRAHSDNPPLLYRMPRHTSFVLRCWSAEGRYVISLSEAR